MKIDRLIGIITVLLQQEKVTAAYLAKKFEVSKRTINRDIDDICKAGIPIATLQGAKGGISIAKGYKIDKTLFTQNELKAVFSGLCVLDSVSQDKKYQNIMGKFFMDKDKLYTTNNIMIDLSSHYKSSLAPKINSFLQAIENKTETEFTYYSAKGERLVAFRPCHVLFQWTSWYVIGYDVEKADFRMFKLNRLCNLIITKRNFTEFELPSEKTKFHKYFTDEIDAVIFFDGSVKYRLIEEYGTDCFTVLENNKLRFEFSFTNKEFLIGWVLGFGDKAELIKPAELRSEIKNRLKNSLNQYIE